MSPARGGAVAPRDSGAIRWQHGPPMDPLVARWTVPFADRPYAVARYGHWGAPLLLFPTGGSDYLDNERFRLVDALGPLMEAGRVKVYSVDAPNKDAWTHAGVGPARRAAMQAAYDRWLVDVLLPWIDADCAGGGGPVLVAGASLGAYQALNAFTRHPERIGAGIGLSGTYVLDRRMDGQLGGEDYYHQQPTRFLPNLGPGAQLDALRAGWFQFGLGGGPHENPRSTWHAAEVLGSRGVPNHVEVWGPDADHDWPTWRAMLPGLVDRALRRRDRRAA